MSAISGKICTRGASSATLCSIAQPICTSDRAVCQKQIVTWSKDVAITESILASSEAKWVVLVTS